MNFSYNPDFYPTPREVIEKMLMDDSPAGLVVLEPSAGSGNIARALREAGAAEVLTCEIDPNLQPILRRDGFRLIASDFMSVTAEQVSHVNMIVMNPPFSQGVRHIQHAYDIAPAGCVIVALCNTSNLESSYYSHYREFAELVNLHGYAESLGDVFSTAERKTNCRVSLVKLWKEGKGADEFTGYFSACEECDNGGNGEQAGLMQYNFLRDIVNRYIEAVKLFDGVLEATEKINRAASYVDYTVETDKDGNQKAIKHTYGALPVSFQPVTYNRERGRDEIAAIDHATYKKELQKYYWRIIFAKMNMEKYATRELREQINKFIEQRQNVPFTMGNIYRVIETVVKTNGQRMTRALCEAFDTICSLSAENSTAGETWKTNSNYMVNRRFICDWITERSSWGDKMEVSDWHNKAEKINDVCKALCYMTGIEFSSIGNLGEHVRNTSPAWGTWFEWGFFRCRGYKKGTMHFEFIDENVWARFNQEVAKSKGWKIGSTTNSEHGHKQNRRK